ncbi:plasmid partitioning protein RepB C-terminal domain-containing protein [Chitinimonas naiadis]
MNSVVLGFIPETLSVPVDCILPSRRTPTGVCNTRKYRQIRSSIEEVGLIEPLSVTAVEQTSGQHMLLDGHIRLIVLRELKYEQAPCLIATDDEAYTYNNRINRLATIQEHYMIRRAVERGVSPERLAKVLSVDVSQIVKRMNLLDGLCPEAIELLKDQRFSPEVVRAIRKMKPTRQVECIELMIAANNLSVSYAEALLVATPAQRLVKGKKPARLTGVTPEQMARMEREMTNLQEQYKVVEQTYGQDVLNLVLARGYLARLLENAAVSAYIRRLQPELVQEFESILEIASLEQ